MALRLESAMRYFQYMENNGRTGRVWTRDKPVMGRPRQRLEEVQKNSRSRQSAQGVYTFVVIRAELTWMHPN